MTGTRTELHIVVLFPPKDRKHIGSLTKDTGETDDSGPEQQDLQTSETCHVQELGRVQPNTIQHGPSGDQQAEPDEAN